MRCSSPALRVSIAIALALFLVIFLSEEADRIIWGDHIT